MRITAKGQVTIPKEVRERAGLLPHTEVTFVLEGESVRIVKAEARKGESRGEVLVRLLRGRKGVGMSTDQILELTRGR